MGAPEKEAKYATIFNCYCRTCAYKCDKETIISNIDMKEKKCFQYKNKISFQKHST